MSFRPATSNAWVSALAPLGPVQTVALSTHSDILANRIDVDMQVWEKPQSDPVPTRTDTYGWKPLLAPTLGSPSRTVGEVELVRRLEEAGYRAFWVDTFGGAPEIWRRWARRPSELPQWFRAIDAAIRSDPAMASYPTGGIPDVLAFHPETSEYVLVEYKGPSVANPRRHDKINEKQDAWYRTAIALSHLTPTAYVVAEWRPTPQAAHRLAEQKAWQADRP